MKGFFPPCSVGKDCVIDQYQCRSALVLAWSIQIPFGYIHSHLFRRWLITLLNGGKGQHMIEPQRQT